MPDDLVRLVFLFTLGARRFALVGTIGKIRYET